MRLLRKLLDHTSWLTHQSTQPAQESVEGHRLMYRWYRNTSATYEARMNSPHPRTIRVPAGNNAACYAPGAPYHRMRLILGNGNYSAQGTVVVAGSRRLGDYASIHTASIPNNAYTVVDFDAKTIGSGDYYPASYRVTIQPAAQPAELGDLALYAYTDLTNLLTDLVPVRSQYETSIFTPLSDNAFLARSLTTRAYQLVLLVPRSEPALQWLLSLKEHDQLELETDGYYIPCAVQTADTKPAGGALWEIQLQLIATANYAYSPQRHIAPYTHSSQADLHGYEIPGDAPAPAEIRIQITNIGESNLTLHLPAAGETLAFRPDATGIWSIHDTGRIYHSPTGAPSTITDRTDVLKRGALPVALPSGDGLFALQYGAGWGIPAVTLALYPRRLVESVL